MGAFDDLIPGGNLTVSEGKPGVGTNEAKTREAQFTANQQTREVLRSLAAAQGYNMRLPTGRFNAAKNDFWQYSPSRTQDKNTPEAWKPTQISDYQGFLGLQQELTKPLKSLINPPGTVTGGREMDAVAEQVMAQSMIPGPGKEFRANVDMINRSGRRALDRIAFNAFTSRWRSKHDSVYGKDAKGRTAEQAFADYQRSPEYKKTVLTPYTTLLKNGGRAPVAKPQAKTVAGGDLHQGEDGVFVWNPKGN